MVTRFSIVPRAPQLDFEAFRELWGSRHGALAATLPGLRRYVQNHAVLRDGRPLLPYAGFDGCSELEWDDIEAIDAAFASRHFAEVVSADAADMNDTPRQATHYCRREVVVDGHPGDDPVKLVTLLPLDPRASREQLLTVVRGPLRVILADARPLRHEQLIADPGLHEGRPPPLAAAVDLLWLASEQEAIDMVCGAVGDRAGYALAGVSLGQCRS